MISYRNLDSSLGSSATSLSALLARSAFGRKLVLTCLACVLMTPASISAPQSATGTTKTSKPKSAASKTQDAIPMAAEINVPSQKGFGMDFAVAYPSRYAVLKTELWARGGDENTPGTWRKCPTQKECPGLSAGFDTIKDIDSGDFQAKQTRFVISADAQLPHRARIIVYLIPTSSK